jgi:cell division protein FtsZ
VLHGAVAGIAEVIKCPGLVNVDFADVRTVMSEMGMAMMGSAHASGLDRASIAAERAVSSPLLEDVNLSGARGVLVNITANASIKLKEIHDAMNTIKAFAAEDATVIVGQVIDENMGDDLRVTIVATGLGAPIGRQQSKPLAVVKTGTDDMPIASADVNYSELEQPAVMRRRRTEQVEALKQSGMEMYDIPAFLRKQAD